MEDDFDAGLADLTGAQVDISDFDFGGSDPSDVMSRAVEKDYGTGTPTQEAIGGMRGFDFGSDAARAAEAQMMAGYAPSGFENQQFINQFAPRLARAEANYGLPSMGLLSAPGFLAQLNLNKQREQLMAGGIPMFTDQGVARGVMSKGLFGFDTYTGMPIEGNLLTGYTPEDMKADEVVPVEEETGKCPEGYIFDEDLQACRLDTGSTVAEVATTEFEPGGYARVGLLDQPPQGLLEVGGQPYDFEAANRAYRLATATRPEYYSDPYNLQGYTLLA